MLMTISVASTAFAEEERIPSQYTSDGADISPPLEWSDVPEGTKELALICDDPDAPTDEPWVHWVIYKIPGNASGLPEGMPKQARLKNGGMLQGQNSWSKATSKSFGYRGPNRLEGTATTAIASRCMPLAASWSFSPGSRRGSCSAK